MWSEPSIKLAKMKADKKESSLVQKEGEICSLRKEAITVKVTGEGNEKCEER